MPGSPPLARGTLIYVLLFVMPSGITPARAGNTTSASPFAPENWDHPRSRGEHLLSMLPFSLPQGSPPLARGTLYPSSSDLLTIGITPARAGNTFPIKCKKCRGRDHPRSRGEHRVYSKSGLDPRGSPPLARGTQLEYITTDPLEGITPARAGNTREATTFLFVLWDHPRSRGEHTKKSVKIKALYFYLP